MKTFSTTTSLALTWALVLFCTSALQAKIHYVRPDANGLNNGNSWTDAYTSLQTAIDAAAIGDTVCVAAGTYHPTTKLNGDTDLHLTFYINKDIALFGGFQGDPGSEGNFSVRDPKVHVTILSGDIGVQGDSVDNVFHVMYIDQVSDTMQLDGFTISGAYGFLGGGLDNTGGGIFLDGEAGRCSPVISNCIIRDNDIQESGAGVVGYASQAGIVKPRFVNCAFLYNSGSGGGGYFGNVDSGGEESAVFISCEFKGNEARTANGGAIGSVAHSSISNHVFVNCVITGNSSPFSAAYNAFVTGTGLASPRFINSTIVGNSGGSLRVSDIGTGASGLTIRNSIVWGNPNGHGIVTSGGPTDVTYSLVQFTFAGEGNISLNPEFVEEPLANSAPHASGDVHLKSTSSAIDAGRNSDVPDAITTDKDGKARFVDPGTGQPGTVDMGAYELQEFPVSTTGIFLDDAIKAFPNPVSDQLYIMLSDEVKSGVLSLVNSQGIHLDRVDIAAIHDSGQMDVSHLSGGLYFLSWSSGEKYGMLPVVIQK